jgi:formylglycine-generating enzyme
MHRLQSFWTTVIIGTAILLAAAAARLSADAIAWAYVGDAGNAADARDAAHGGTPGRGAVAYPYQIGKCEVTNGQYCEFLNAKAKSNAHNLYNSYTSSDPQEGILYSGAEGSYSYTVKDGHERQPAAFVTWLNAVRFVNWLQNGGGDGDTETGTYAIATVGSTTTVAVPTAADRANWTTPHYVLPTEDEWYKAAYYKGGSLSAGYRTYAFTVDDSIVSDQPPGDATHKKYSANIFKDDGISNGYNDGYALTGSSDHYPDPASDYLTDTGAYTSAESAYHTFDQDGNVCEWTESVLQSDPSKRIFRGGSWRYNAADYAAASTPQNGSFDTTNGPDLGFRVGLILPVPEPNAWLLLGWLGGGAAPIVLFRRRRQARRAFGGGGNEVR